MSSKFSTALILALFFSGVSHGFECQRVLKEMRLVELDLLPQTNEGRSIASIDSSATMAAKQKRIAKMKFFLKTAPIEKQRAFAILLVNYFLDVDQGKPGNLLDGMDLIDSPKKETAISIQPNDPKNEILGYLMKTTISDLRDVQGLIVYLLRAKNLKTSPNQVLTFLKEQITKGNSHFALLEKNCVAGDPTLEKVAAAQAHN